MRLLDVEQRPTIATLNLVRQHREASTVRYDYRTRESLASDNEHAKDERSHRDQHCTKRKLA
jgi:hypothetical protein